MSWPGTSPNPRDKAQALELELFEALAGDVAGQSEDVALAAHALAVLDWAASLGELAIEQDYCRPGGG